MLCRPYSNIWNHTSMTRDIKWPVKYGQILRENNMLVKMHQIVFSAPKMKYVTKFKYI